MTMIISVTGKPVKAKFLPKTFSGDRLPLNYGDCLSRSSAQADSLWNTYTLQTILQANCGLLCFDGQSLTKLD